MDLRDYIRVIRRRWAALAILAPVVFAGMYVAQTAQPVTFGASVSFYFRALPVKADPEAKDLYPPYVTNPEMRPYLVTSPEVLQRVVEELGRQGMEASVRSLRASVNAKLGARPEIVEISCSEATAERALKVRDVTRRVYVEYEIEVMGSLADEQIRLLQSGAEELEEQARERERDLRELLRQKYLTRGVAQPDIEAAVQSQLILDLQRMRQENLIEARKIQFTIRDEAEEQGSAAVEEAVARHLFPGFAAGPVDDAPSQLSSRLDELERDLEVMRRRYHEVHPAMVQTRDEIAVLHERIRNGADLNRLRRARDLARRKKLLEGMAALLVEIVQQEYQESLLLAEDRKDFDKVNRAVEQVQSRLAGVKGRLEEALESKTIRKKGEQAVVTVLAESGPVPDRRPPFVPLLAVVAVVIGLGAAFLLEFLSPYVTSEHDVRRYANLKTLLTVIRVRLGEEYLVVPAQTPLAEIFNSLAVALDGHAQAADARVVLVAGPDQGGGKTTIAVNTAMALARMGLRVLLIDGDLRRPTVAKALGIEGTVDLATVLQRARAQGALAEENLETEATTVIQATEVDRLHVIAGTKRSETPLELLRHDDLRRLLNVYRSRYDLILMDSPPANIVADPVHLARLSDAIVLVVAAGHTRKEDLTYLRRRLDASWEKVLGSVLNMAPHSVAGYYYYYRSYYGPGERGHRVTR
jgi:capsular exopolysaccharide synthesis family protein